MGAREDGGQYQGGTIGFVTVGSLIQVQFDMEDGTKHAASSFGGRTRLHCDLFIVRLPTSTHCTAGVLSIQLVLSCSCKYLGFIAWRLSFASGPANPLIRVILGQRPFYADASYAITLAFPIFVLKDSPYV